MTETEPRTLPLTAGRIESIDILRGLVIILMVFVNDVAGLSNAPAWLKHVSASTDGMTLPDVVFPAFLFVVGMSIPLALGRRFAKGERHASIACHVLLRAFSLIVIGVLMVNRPSAEVMGLPDGLWQFLMYALVLVAWHTIPAKTGKAILASRIVRVIGIAGLIALAVVFRNRNGGWLEHSWWGILGLIGWAYLIAVAVYVILRDNRTALIGAMSLLYCFFIAYREGKFGGFFLNGSTVGSHPAIVVAGIVAGTLVATPSLSHNARIRWMLAFAGFMFIAGWLLRPLYGVSKIGATPGWCLWSSAYTLAAWALLYRFIDAGRGLGALRPVSAVGSNALFAYIFPSMIYYLFTLTGIGYYSIGRGSVAVGLTRSAVFTAVMTAFAGWVGRRGLRLKL